MDSSPSTTYNITACCKAASVLPQCMPLCTYDIKVSDLQLLGQACSLQMGMYKIYNINIVIKIHFTNLNRCTVQVRSRRTGSYEMLFSPRCCFKMFITMQRSYSSASSRLLGIWGQHYSMFWRRHRADSRSSRKFPCDPCYQIIHFTWMDTERRRYQSNYERSKEN